MPGPPRDAGERGVLGLGGERGAGMFEELFGRARELRERYAQGVTVVRGAVGDVRQGLSHGDDPVEVAVDLVNEFRQRLDLDQLAGSLAIALILLAQKEEEE